MAWVVTGCASASPSLSPTSRSIQGRLRCKLIRLHEGCTTECLPSTRVISSDRVSQSMKAFSTLPAPILVTKARLPVSRSSTWTSLKGQILTTPPTSSHTSANSQSQHVLLFELEVKSKNQLLTQRNILTKEEETMRLSLDCPLNTSRRSKFEERFARKG
jgi:hypothetical protein